jgi:hypothetical protein
MEGEKERRRDSEMQARRAWRDEMVECVCVSGLSECGV